MCVELGVFCTSDREEQGTGAGDDRSSAAGERIHTEQ